MYPLKIAREVYQRASHPALATIADNIGKSMDGVAAYQSLQPQLQTLIQRSTVYQTCLVAAHNRGRSEIVAKKLARTALLQQLDQIATALEQVAQDNLQLIIDAGFSVQPQKSARVSDKLPVPVILQASSTGKKGEIQVRLDNRAPRGAVVTHAVEYSLNREEGWQNGAFHTHRRFVAEGLPRAEALWLRTRSLGHGSSRSEWSQPVMVAVL